MEIKNELYPVTEEQQRSLGEPGPDGRIVMVNLLKFRERASYPDGSDSDLSGRDVYCQRFVEPAARLIREHGGRILYDGDVTFLMCGQADDLWDQVAVVEYPNRSMFVAMLRSDALQALTVHREATLEGQLNIETTWNPIPGAD